MPNQLNQTLKAIKADILELKINKYLQNQISYENHQAEVHL